MQRNESEALALAIERSAFEVALRDPEGKRGGTYAKAASRLLLNAVLKLVSMLHRSHLMFSRMTCIRHGNLEDMVILFRVFQESNGMAAEKLGTPNILDQDESSWASQVRPNKATNRSDVNHCSIYLMREDLGSNNLEINSTAGLGRHRQCLGTAGTSRINHI